MDESSFTASLWISSSVSSRSLWRSALHSLRSSPVRDAHKYSSRYANTSSYIEGIDAFENRIDAIQLTFVCPISNMPFAVSMTNVHCLHSACGVTCVGVYSVDRDDQSLVSHLGSAGIDFAEYIIANGR